MSLPANRNVPCVVVVVVVGVWRWRSGNRSSEGTSAVGRGCWRSLPQQWETFPACLQWKAEWRRSSALPLLSIQLLPCVPLSRHSAVSPLLPPLCCPPWPSTSPPWSTWTQCENIETRCGHKMNFLLWRSWNCNPFILVLTFWNDLWRQPIISINQNFIYMAEQPHISSRLRSTGSAAPPQATGQHGAQHGGPPWGNSGATK